MTINTQQNQKILAYHHTEQFDGWETQDMGGIIYMADGRVIKRKPNQDIRDAIFVGEAP